MAGLVIPNVVPFLLEQAADEFTDCRVTDILPLGRTLDDNSPLIAIYEQDNFRATDVSWQPVIGYKIYAGSREWPDPARLLAGRVEAWLWQAWLLPGDNPVAACLVSNGPNLVPEEFETAVFYGTVEMVTAGVYRPARTG